MISKRTPDGQKAEPPGEKSRWVQRAVLGAVCALVIGLYAWPTSPLISEWGNTNPARTHYNLLVDGFRAGQLSLKKEAPPGLRQLADPYDPIANAPYQQEPHWLHDMSYYKGKLYLYFGIPPALLLFWPWVALTGHYLFHKHAAVIFCSAGFLAAAGLLRALQRRYFPETGTGVMAAGLVALGLATGVPVMLQGAGVCEVPISCAYALTMLALVALWRALHEPAKRGRWLAAASLAYGLAVGARPSMLFGAVILLAPVAQAWLNPAERGRKRLDLGLLAAAAGPLMLIGLGLMLYNHLRFGNPFEFGQHYQLAGDRQDSAQHFSLRYLWFNLRVYFFEPMRWSGDSPFVQGILAPLPPPGHAGAEDPFGVLTNLPVVWLALAAPLAWRGRPAEARFVLRCFLTAVALLFGICALTVCFFYGSCSRYEMEFLPALLLLTVAGILGVERALATRPAWRRASRWAWGALLAFSVALNLLMSIQHYAEKLHYFGNALLQCGRVSESVPQYEAALRLSPRLGKAHHYLGAALLSLGRVPEAISHYETALRLAPRSAEAYNSLGTALLKADRMAEAMERFGEALRLRPDYAEARYNLGNALFQQRRFPEAKREYEQALQIRPDYPEAHGNLGIVLARMGRNIEAIRHLEEALRLRPGYVDAHNNLGVVLFQMGRLPEAEEHFRQALQIKPDCANARTNLARLRALRQAPSPGK